MMLVLCSQPDTSQSCKTELPLSFWWLALGWRKLVKDSYMA